LRPLLLKTKAEAETLETDLTMSRLMNFCAGTYHPYQNAKDYGPIVLNRSLIGAP
jgi:hypothetical protein